MALHDMRKEYIT